MKTMVFYSENTRDTGMFGITGPKDDIYDRVQAAVRDSRNYRHVCTFEQAESLEAAYEALQSEVSSTPRDLKVRSMMVGDVLLQGERVFVVASCGFEELKGGKPLAYRGAQLVRQIDTNCEDAPVLAAAVRGVR